MFSGLIQIDIKDPNTYDKVWVDGYAALGAVQNKPGGKVVGNLLPNHADIPANTTFTFLSRADKPQNSNFANNAPL